MQRSESQKHQNFGTNLPYIYRKLTKENRRHLHSAFTNVSHSATLSTFGGRHNVWRPCISPRASSRGCSNVLDSSNGPKTSSIHRRVHAGKRKSCMKFVSYRVSNVPLRYRNVWRPSDVLRRFKQRVEDLLQLYSTSNDLRKRPNVPKTSTILPCHAGRTKHTDATSLRHCKIYLAFFNIGG